MRTRDGDSSTEPIYTELIDSPRDIMNKGKRVNSRKVSLEGFNLHSLWYGEPVTRPPTDHEAMREYFETH